MSNRLKPASEVRAQRRDYAAMADGPQRNDDDDNEVTAGTVSSTSSTTTTTAAANKEKRRRAATQVQLPFTSVARSNNNVNNNQVPDNNPLRVYGDHPSDRGAPTILSSGASSRGNDAEIRTTHSWTNIVFEVQNNQYACLYGGCGARLKYDSRDGSTSSRRTHYRLKHTTTFTALDEAQSKGGSAAVYAEILVNTRRNLPSRRQLRIGEEVPEPVEVSSVVLVRSHA
jgi:hypothetical protein